MKDENKKILEDIIERKDTSAEAQEAVKAVALDEGLSIETKVTNTRCKNCWLDAAMELLGKAKAEEKSESGSHYVLREGVDVWFGEKRINNATLTDDLARIILSKGFDPRFFSNIPGDED